MAIDKRCNTRSLVPSRNVRAKMIIDRIKSKPYTPILRKRKRYSSDNTVAPLSLLQSNENVENGPSSEEEHEEEGPLKVTISPCKSPRIRFKSTVQVAHIPSRFHYPELMKQSLWGTLKEIHENARRNTIEFAAEGWDWRAATEDDEMYVTKSGDRIHPAHVRKVYTITPTKCEEEGQGDQREGGEVMVEDRIETHC